MSYRSILKRVGIALITLLASMALTFFLLRLTPGNVYDRWANDLAKTRGIAYDEARQLVIQMSNYNPNEPLLSQFGRYVNGILHGNFGTSMYNSSITVGSILAKALPWTLFMVTVSLLLSFLIGMSLGIIMAWKRKGVLYPIISIYSIITGSIPNFLFAIILMIIFAFKLKWFPMRGAYDANVATPGFNIKFIINVLYHAALPIFTFVLTSIGGWALSMYSTSVSVLGEDYVNAAYIRGVPEDKIMKNYLKKNAMLPQITALAISFGFMLGGSPLIENQFNYPGMGFYMADASGKRDYAILQGLLFITSFAVILANLLSDLIYAKLDPRVKLEE